MKILFLSGLLSLSGSAYALRISHAQNQTNPLYDQGLTQTEFESTLRVFKEEFTPLVSQFGKELDVTGRWDSDMDQAIAQQDRFAYYITVYGGVARNPFMTIDTLLLTLCHELSHHLGGNPKNSHPNIKWSSVEGQADYYAASTCMPLILPKYPATVKLPKGSKVLKAKCRNRWRTETEYQQCLRIGVAARNFVLSLSAGAEIGYDKRDVTVVDKTDEHHPSHQCRLDTFVLGALKGARPHCWYKAEQ